ncbi:MAG: DUF3667 domain-containing protein [Chitinophagaceae bacterium]|nr:DUF3667 domain-containing protein [Chitinophagaceae bacterium]
MQEACPNCNTIVSPGQKFCPGCGQKNKLPRITVRVLIKDFLQYIFNAEKGILNLLKGLATRPGHVVTEFAEGKRKKYFNPFSFLAICVAFMVLMNSWIKPYAAISAVPKEYVLDRIPGEETKDIYRLTVKREAQIQGFFNRNMNFGTLITAPFFAFFLWLFFQRRGRNMAETAVAFILLTAFISMVHGVLISPGLAMTRDSNIHSYLTLAAISMESFYYAWGLKKFFGYKTSGGYFKILLVLWLAGLIGMVLILVFYYIYVYHGGASIVLQYL